ncbi:MAG TPA: hypothetical protein VHO91_21775 [Rhodopila sp.]|nr:hypothetical protein [Rhodopila sp.]
MLMIASIGTSGCSDRDPYLRTDVWRPTGANAANIAAMVVNPRDLVMGRNASSRDTKAAGLAVEHVWTNQLQPFASSAAGQAGTQPSSSASAGGTGSQ